MPRTLMRFVVQAGAGFSVISVAVEDPWQALERARDLLDQGMQGVTVTDESGEIRTPAEFAQLIGDEPPLPQPD